MLTLAPCAPRRPVSTIYCRWQVLQTAGNPPAITARGTTRMIKIVADILFILKILIQTIGPDGMKGGAKVSQVGGLTD